MQMTSKHMESCSTSLIIQFSSVTQSCPTLCDPMNRSTPGLPVHHQLPEFTQTHVHRVGDAIQPSHLLSSPSPPAPHPSQHQSLFQWVNSSHEMAKVLEFREMQIKTAIRYNLIPVRMLLSSRYVMPESLPPHELQHAKFPYLSLSPGVNGCYRKEYIWQMSVRMWKEGTLCTVGRDVNWYSHCGKHYGCFSIN